MFYSTLHTVLKWSGKQSAFLAIHSYYTHACALITYVRKGTFLHTVSLLPTTNMSTNINQFNFISCFIKNSCFSTAIINTPQQTFLNYLSIERESCVAYDKFNYFNLIKKTKTRLQMITLKTNYKTRNLNFCYSSRFSTSQSRWQRKLLWNPMWSLKSNNITKTTCQSKGNQWKVYVFNKKCKKTVRCGKRNKSTQSHMHTFIWV